VIAFSCSNSANVSARASGEANNNRPSRLVTSRKSGTTSSTAATSGVSTGRPAVSFSTSTPRA